jgi:UDP-N-acetylmuramoyl-L-alanyl-D-glutamate--2,6-diaminopimelate ligase
LTAGLIDAEISGDADVNIENIEYDSRMIKPNALFIAVKGFRHDGYDYAEQAKENGAVAIMGERESCNSTGVHVRVKNVREAMAEVAARFYGYPGLKIKALGVTGTNGKTTVCFLLKEILEARNKTVGLVTSSVYDTGKEVFPAERTTPEALDLQRLLVLMKKNYCVNAVIEVSSHALTLHRVDHINFKVALYTNITRDHLDFHDSMDDYLKAKAALLKRLEGPLSYAVINLDVPEFRALFGEFTSSYMTYSASDSNADVYCSRAEIGRDGTIFDLVTPMGTRTVELQLPGQFNLINAICAAAGGLAAGVDLDSVVIGLENALPVPGRFNPIVGGQPFGVYVDFAHTPDALLRLCETARELTDGRLLLLFGCGGDRDKGKRPMMAEAAGKADYAIVTSDNPRGEDPMSIIEDIKPGFVEGKYEIEPNRAEAIRTIIRKANDGDVVLLAGKGAEKYQEISGKFLPFSDVDEARKALAEMGYDAANEKEEI